MVSLNEVDAIICKWLYKLLDGEVDIEKILEGTQQELEDLLEKKE